MSDIQANAALLTEAIDALKECDVDYRTDALLAYRPEIVSTLRALLSALSAAEARAEAAEARVGALEAQLNTPEVEDFAKATVSEAQHQRARWGSSHDAGKQPLDWFWLIGYLAQKAATAHMAGDAFKAKHHTISTAAALANWHAAISGQHTDMRPGIETPEFDCTLKGSAK